MIDRPPALAKLLPLLAVDGRLTEAMRPIWSQLGPPLADRLRLGMAEQEQLRDECLLTLRNWAQQLGDGRPSRAALQQWLVRLRQDVSLEGLLLALVQLDRALRQAGWQLGLSAPDWLALSELMSGFFEALFEEAAAGWQGLLAQNYQLRDELGYFHRLAASLEAGQDLSDHLQMAVRETARLLHCEFCAILLPREKERDVLAIRAAVAPRILSNALEGMAFPLAENGLIAQVFLTGAPASTYQPLDDLEVTMRRRQTLESLGFSQLMAYPLQTHGRVLGVLCVANRLDDQPWQALEEEWLATVAGQLSASIRLSQTYTRQESSEAELTRALVQVMGQKDPGLLAHGEAVGRLAVEIGGMLGLSGARLESLGFAGQLHDLGLMFVPDAVRLRPGPLTPADAVLVRRHPQLAANMLGPFKALEGVLPAVKHHHERWDGQGYPSRLRSQDIPLEARILAAADTFHTLVTPQTYQVAVTEKEALEELARGAGTQFDPLVVQALAQVRASQAPGLGLPMLRPPALAAPESPESPAVDDHAGPLDGALAVPVGTPRLMGLLAELVATAEPQAFFGKFWDTLAAHCPLDAAALWRMQGVVKLELTEAFGWEDFPGPRRVPETGLETYVAACQVPVAAADLTSDVRFALPESMQHEGFVTAMALPLVAADRLLGVLTVYRRRQAPFVAADQALLELSSGMLALALESQDLRERHVNLLNTDALTGLASHRAFADRLLAELKRAERFDLPLSAVLVDLDDFAAYNEAHGYALGDEVLKQLAELLVARVRTVDSVARFGGDSLAVLLPECGAPEAMAIAEEVRVAVAASLFPSRHAGGAKLTVSVGVTTRQGRGAVRQGFLDDLETAQEKACHEGANRLLFHASAVPEGV